MVLEYLIKTEQNADKVISIVADSELITSKKKLTDNQYIVAVEMKGESESNAKKLSDINDSIMFAVAPTILSNGAAGYFNKVLFPLVNDFERKLRKLLYAASALKPGEKDTIINLEEKDFGTIFDALFLDSEFWNRVKSYVCGNKKTGESWSGYYYELKTFLDNENEDLLWDRLLPEQVPLLREKFEEIRLRRNDIMHAHNINKTEFGKTRKIFEKVNQELDNAIEGLADGALIPDTYNKEIEDVFFLVTDSGAYLTDENGVPFIAEIRKN